MQLTRLTALATTLALPLLAAATPAPLAARADTECCDSTLPVRPPRALPRDSAC